LFQTVAGTGIHAIYHNCQRNNIVPGQVISYQGNVMHRFMATY